MTKNKEIKAKKRVKAVTESVNTFNIGQRVIHEGKKHVVLAIFSTFNIQDNELGKDPVVYSLCEIDNIKNIPVSREKFIFKTLALYNAFDKVRKAKEDKKKEAEEKAKFLKLKEKYDK